MVGATRVLRPAVLEGTGRGWTVVAVARSRADLAVLAAVAGPLVLPVPLDVGDARAVDHALAHTVLRDHVDDALVYYATGNDVSENEAVDRLAPVVAGTMVRILTSRWFPTDETLRIPADVPGDHGRRPRPPGRVHLLLGVRPSPTGKEWHDPEEISAAAFAALQGRHDSVLGVSPSHRSRGAER